METGDARNEVIFPCLYWSFSCILLVNSRWCKLQFCIFGVDERFNCFWASVFDLVKFGAISFVGGFGVGFLVRSKELVLSEFFDLGAFDVVSIINIKSLHISFHNSKCLEIVMFDHCRFCPIVFLVKCILHVFFHCRFPVFGREVR